MHGYGAIQRGRGKLQMGTSSVKSDFPFLISHQLPGAAPQPGVGFESFTCLCWDLDCLDLVQLTRTAGVDVCTSHAMSERYHSSDSSRSYISPCLLFHGVLWAVMEGGWIEDSMVEHSLLLILNSLASWELLALTILYCKSKQNKNISDQGWKQYKSMDIDINIKKMVWQQDCLMEYH